MMERTFPVLDTGRLILRRIMQSDIDAIYKLYSDPKVAKYDVFMPISSKDSARSIIVNYNREFEAGKGIRWGISAKDTGCIIGTCGFLNFDWGSRRCEIGFGLIPEEWGKGIMAEAIGKIVSYGFSELGLNRIEAFVDIDNSASLSLLQKSNFRQEGILRDREYYKGRHHNEIVLSILACEFNR